MSGHRSDMSGLDRICPVWGPDMSSQTGSRAAKKVDQEARR
jgi:hypothetical protein